jgi:hypothetical protein
MLRLLVAAIILARRPATVRWDRDLLPTLDLHGGILRNGGERLA